MSVATEHNSLIDVPKRSLTPQEEEWVSEIVISNSAWADVDLGELFVIAECTCGCRSIILEEPAFVQNPKVSTQKTVVAR